MLCRLLLCALVTLPPLSVAAQSIRSHDDPYGPELNYFKREQANRVSLLSADNRGFEVARVMIDFGGEVLAVNTADGVQTRNENRVRLRDLPIAGGLFENRFSRDDLAPGNRIGAVYRQGDTLRVEVGRDQPRYPITRVAILNQDNAYFLNGDPQPTRIQLPPGGAPVGQAFIKNGAGLLLLIEPSVIQHSIF